MSHIPPAYETPSNPDNRPLPQGWVQQYDDEHKTWFYVNTFVSPSVTQWTHPCGHIAPPPASPPPQYDPPNHELYLNEKKSSDGPYKNSIPRGYQGEYEDYDSYPQQHYQGGYGGRHEGGHGGPSHKGTERATFGGLLGRFAEAKVNRRVQKHKARWEYKKAKVDFLLGGASLIGNTMTGGVAEQRI